MRAFTFFDLAFLGGLFNTVPCSAGLSGIDGGNTFDCYDDGDASTFLITAGKGISGIILARNILFRGNGETFESYSDGAASEGVPPDSAMNGYTYNYFG